MRNRALALLPLLVLNLLLSSSALANTPYLVEVIVFRQAAAPLPAAQLAPDDWAQGAPRIDGTQRPTALDAEAGRLTPASGYQVLLHQAWSQTIGSAPSTVALSSGSAPFGHHPLEGTLSLSSARFVELDMRLWINQLDASGVLIGSERFKQVARLKTGELTFIDHGSLGMLIRLSPL